MKLTSHEEKILRIIEEYPDIITDPKIRKEVAGKYGLSEKTLRNRIGDLKKYGFIGVNNTKKSINLNDDEEIADMFQLLNIIFLKKYFIIRNMILIFLISCVLVLILPKTYTSSAVLMPPTSESGGAIGSIMGALSSLPIGGFGGQTSDESLSIIAILKSRTLSEKAIKNFDLLNFYGVPNVDKALIALSESIVFEVLEEGTINISVSLKTKWFHNDESEREVKTLCTNMALFFVTELDILNKSLKTEQASFHRKFIEQRYKQNLIDLENAEDSLRSFQEKHKMVALNEQTSAAIEAAASIKAQMLSNEVKLGVMLGALNKKHPDIENIRIENYELSKKMDELEYGVEVIGFDKSNLFPILSEIPELGVELIRLKREVEIQNTLFVFLTQQYEEAKIKEAKDTPTVQILDYPKIPNLKSGPKRMIIVLICLFVSFFVNILFILKRYNVRL